MRIVSRVLAVAFILFCFEIGFFLVLVPWSSLWENNLLFLYAPGVRAFVISAPARVSVSILGVLDLLMGVSEARRFLRTSRWFNADNGGR